MPGVRTEAEWHEAARDAPYRASTKGKTRWTTNKPGPDIAEVSRIVRGGREMFAFKLGALRDYFVEGHEEQDARIEADWADMPGPKRRLLNPGPQAETLAQAIEDHVAANFDHARAMKGMDAAFGDAIRKLYAEDDIPGALAVLNSMPGGVAKDVMISSMGRLGGLKPGQPHLSFVWAEYTSERAEAMLAMARAERRAREAGDRLDALARPIVDAAVEKRDLDALERLVQALPASVTKALVSGKARAMRIDADVKSVFDEAPSAPGYGA